MIIFPNLLETINEICYDKTGAIHIVINEKQLSNIILDLKERGDL